MVEAILKEITLRKDFLSEKSLASIYFGGGTPSLLDKNDLDKIFSALAKTYTWDSTTEITLESNPDDLSIEYLKDLKSTGINRLSIGIQSFDQSDLSYMNRAHNATEAEACIKQAQDLGFDNITGDLIYASPTTSHKTWQDNIDKMLSFNIPHISAYCLTVEEGTALHHFVKTGKSKPVDDEKATYQFNLLMESLSGSGYDHYEISNFGKPGNYAIHNTNYWMGKPYLGLGPAAHSFDGINTRSWNLAHNPQYIKSIQNSILPIEQEVLSEKEMYNEFVLIRLRTKWGIDEKTLSANFQEFETHFKQQIAKFIDEGTVIFANDSYILSKGGKHLADRISMELFAD